MSGEQKKIKINVLLLKEIFTYVKPYKKYLYSSIFLALLMAAVAPIRPFLIQITVDKATGKDVLIPNWFKLFLSNHHLTDVESFVIAVTFFQIVFIILETIIRFCFSSAVSK